MTEYFKNWTCCRFGCTVADCTRSYKKVASLLAHLKSHKGLRLGQIALITFAPFVSK